MRPPLIGIIEEPDVAVDHATAPARSPHGQPHRKGHCADENRQAGLPLYQRVAGDPVINPVAGVVRLGNDRVEGDAIERRVHLIGNLLKSAAQNRQRDRVRHDILPAPNAADRRSAGQIPVRAGPRIHTALHGRVQIVS